jgi:hypothetical protein
MNLGVHIMVDDPDKLEDIRKRYSIALKLDLHPVSIDFG